MNKKNKPNKHHKDNNINNKTIRTRPVNAVNAVKAVKATRTISKRITMSPRNNSFNTDSELIGHISPLKFSPKRSSSPKIIIQRIPLKKKDHTDKPEEAFPELINDFYNDIVLEVENCMQGHKDPVADIKEYLKNEFMKNQRKSVSISPSSSSTSDSSVEMNALDLLRNVNNNADRGRRYNLDNIFGIMTTSKCEENKVFVSKNNNLVRRLDTVMLRKDSQTRNEYKNQGNFKTPDRIFYPRKMNAL